MNGMFMRGFSSFFLISSHFLKFQNGSQNGYKVVEMMIDSFNEIVWGSNSAMICQNKSLLTSASTSDSGCEDCFFVFFTSTAVAIDFDSVFTRMRSRPSFTHSLKILSTDARLHATTKRLHEASVMVLG